MSGQQQGQYEGAAMGNYIDPYYNEYTNNPSAQYLPPRGQSLQQQRPPAQPHHESDYARPTSNASYGYQDYYNDPARQQQQQQRQDNYYDQTDYNAYRYQGNEGGYANYGYEGAHVQQAYQQQQQQTYQQPPPTTPMPSHNTYGVGYPPQRLVDPSPQPPLHHAALNNGMNVPSSPPVANANPQQAYAQEYPVRRTPPGSPSMHYQQPPPPVAYAPAGYQQQHAPQPSVTSSYSRPTSQDLAGSYHGSRNSMSSTHSPGDAYRAPSSSTSSGHRRTGSSMKNTITTIERPKYARPSPINTSELAGEDDEVPFIPVSPDSSDEEDDYYYHQPAARAPFPPPQPQPPQHQDHPQEQYEPTVPVAPVAPVDTTPMPAPSQGPPPTPSHEVFPPAQPEQSLSGPSSTEEPERPSRPTPQQQHQRESTLSAISIPDVDYSALSNLSGAFIKKIKALEHVRELFCANEYPESFTGAEAVKALREILADKSVPDGYCILIANALMHCKPALFEPVYYSQKSLITGTVYNSPDEIYTFDEDASENDVPTGILTSLTRCYTYGCETGSGGCYAPRCPNKPEVYEEEFMSHANLSRASSVRSTATLDASTSYPHTAWAQRVPRELLETVTKRERDRQEAINEMIYSEEVYRDDLDALHEVIVTPLSRGTILDEQTRGYFIKQVFNNYEELREVSAALFKDLLELQRRFDKKCVPMIGDILVQHFAYFEKPFTTYSPRVSLSEYLVGAEKAQNPEFSRFLADAEKNPKLRRLQFRHFLLNPVTRMQRYPLLLEAIIKKTDEDHPDYAYLVRCKEVIQGIAAKADSQTESTRRHVEILKINDLLTSKQVEYHDLQLTEPSRRLYYQGDLKRRSQGIEVTEKSDIHAFVFDHVFLMTKARKSNAGDEFRIWKRPIPLLMLFVQGGSDYTGSSTTSMNVQASPLGGVSLTLQHLGQNQRDGIYHFFCNSPEEKQQWIRAIEEAKAAQKKRLGESDIFELRTLDDNSFRYFGSVNSMGGQGKINCSVPFTTIDGELKFVIGTDVGVYIRSQNQANLRRVLSCDNVTQVAVMDRQHILLVLADKTLRAYPIDALNSPTNTKAPDRLAQDVAQHVNFFQVGHCNNKDLVIYKKRKSTSSLFVALEPICDLRDSRSEKLLTQRTGFLGSRTSVSWFKKYKEFYVGADTTNIHFLKSKVSVVVESRGFEIIDPKNLGVGGRNIPDSADPQFNFVQRHAEPLKPLAMYRIQDKFLLCYNRFAFYVNNYNGSLVRVHGATPVLCEWEGTPDHIVYYHPYIVGVSSQFIEVRHVDTGDLKQIIPGENIRLTHYNGASDTPVIHGCMTHSQRPEMQHLFHLWLASPNPRTNSGYPRR